MTKLDTYFAPAERLDNDAIYLQTIKLFRFRNTLLMLDSLPNMVAILNGYRQVIFSNSSFTKMIGADKFEDSLGQRPGELIACIHSHDHIYGCGTSKDCKYCGVILTFLKCQETNLKQENETSITIQKDGKNIPLDIHVLIKPLIIEDETFYLVILTDIDNKKRRENLEKIFLHDLSNTIMSLANRIEFFPHEGLNNIQEDQFLKIHEEVSKLLEELHAQKDLILIENNQLTPHFEEVNSLKVIHSVLNTISTESNTKDKRIVLDDNSDSIDFETDKRLLRRVLYNLIKNALEASEISEEVVIGCTEENKTVHFWIKNQTILTEEIKSHIFQRSFTTKGAGRGLGTYSAKILVEEYLKGQISFESQEGIGTIFHIILKI